MTIANMRIHFYGAQGSGFRICAKDMATSLIDDRRPATKK